MCWRNNKFRIKYDEKSACRINVLSSAGIEKEQAIYNGYRLCVHNKYVFARKTCFLKTLHL